MKYYINEFSPKDFCMNLYFLMRMNIKEMLIEQRQATVFNGILAAAAISKEYAEKYKKEMLANYEHLYTLLGAQPASATAAQIITSRP